MNEMKLLYIDLFCGAGGTSTGVEMATIYTCCYRFAVCSLKLTVHLQ